MLETVNSQPTIAGSQGCGRARKRRTTHRRQRWAAGECEKRLRSCPCNQRRASTLAARRVHGVQASDGSRSHQLMAIRKEATLLSKSSLECGLHGGMPCSPTHSSFSSSARVTVGTCCGGARDACAAAMAETASTAASRSAIAAATAGDGGGAGRPKGASARPTGLLPNVTDEPNGEALFDAALFPKGLPEPSENGERAVDCCAAATNEADDCVCSRVEG
eukprot:1837017-Pleurochrysis_carterae.AAC.7